MIQVKTVSHFDAAETDEAEFEKFRKLLDRLYPVTGGIGQRRRIGRTGILYRIPGRETEGDPAVLMAHYDVVPAEASEWDFDPFSGEIKDGFICGRGALDTKCTLCAVMESVENLLKKGWRPKHTLYLSFSGEEEVEGSDADRIVKDFEAAGIRAAFVLDEGGAVIPEGLPGVKRPAAMIGIAEKGVANLELSVSGSGGHASTPPAHTAAGEIARAAAAIEAHPFPAQLTRPVLEMFRYLGEEVPGAAGAAFRKASLLSPAIRAAAVRMGGTFGAMVRTTAAVTVMQGSPSYNVLPEKAMIGVNLRLLGNDTMESACAYLKKAVNNPKIEFRYISGSNPSPVSDCEGDMWKMLTDTIHSTWPEALIAPYTLNGGTDSRFFHRISGCVYKFTPMEMSAEDRKCVHGRNEKIAAGRLLKMAVFYSRLLEKL
jgi:carboxypeptidase PM20D1